MEFDFVRDACYSAKILHGKAKPKINAQEKEKHRQRLGKANVSWLAQFLSQNIPPSHTFGFFACEEFNYVC